ncbi:MAG: circularly permuted type 2 ATP-grasp protein [Burkholderiales bacterium]|nr:circularly permuted type 2 ATP-grasp protein [Burkholderiales bacterium]
MLEEMLKTYPDSDGRFDELFEAPQQPRAHWLRFFRALTATSAQDIRARLAAAERQIRDSGVTYNVYADPQGLDRPWDLDVLPLIIAADEWREIEAGIAQRAQLFDRILADLYGSQSLLQQGLVPPKLIFGQSGFLRPAHGMNLPGGVHLHAYAVDLARSPDGRWWVMADRTQAPSGAGYALENRLIVSRAFPALYRDLRVQHVAHFFATMRDSLQHFAPKGDGPVLTVLLTPGPYNETYFEHALLARYLGFPLVEGGDLTVKGGRVWLKTIGGLKRVHAILRRQDDTFCDPLELRSDSALGVAGLTDCARRGSVLIANALGSGVIESGALLGFLPRLCEHLLGETLRLPSIATWWCGEPAAFADAIDQSKRLVFKSADPAHRFDPVFGEDLDEAGLAALVKKMKLQPERYIAQEFVHVSQAPVLARNQPYGIVARGIGLRVFAIRSQSGYLVMPGGLTRVASGADKRFVSAQRGGGSKDTWVTSSGSVDTSFTLLRSTVSASDLVRSGSAIPSRVAENLFWFGRYEERCDDSARLLRLALNQLLDNDDDEDSIEPVLALTREFSLTEEGEDPESALLAAATQEKSPFGLHGNLRNLEQVAFTLRDRMSMDNWRSINLLVKDPIFGQQVSLPEALDWLDRTINGMMTLSGFALDGMTRDDGWRFLSIGRRLERLSFQCLALQVALQHGRASGLTWLLRLADSVVTYRTRYMARPEWLPVLDLLVLDSANPRSLRFQANGVYSYLMKLEDTYGSCGSELMRPCVEALEGLDPARDLQPENDHLRNTIDMLRSTAFALSDGLSHRFFSHAQTNVWATLGR